MRRDEASSHRFPGEKSTTATEATCWKHFIWDLEFKDCADRGSSSARHLTPTNSEWQLSTQLPGALVKNSGQLYELQTTGTDTALKFTLKKSRLAEEHN